jgi:CO/xanthine dehydrogenase Mo-binding subunit
MNSFTEANHRIGRVIGTSVRRVDAQEKTLGNPLYVDDLSFPEMLHGAVLSSPIAHGYLNGVDLEETNRQRGVIHCLTAKDIPGDNQIGAIVEDQPLLAEEKVRYMGEPIALVSATDPRTARIAIARARVDTEPLPGVFSVEEAMKDNAPGIHGGEGNRFVHYKIRKGNAEEGFRRSDFIVEHTFTVPHQEHMYLEPQGAIAVPGDNGGIDIYGSMQCPFYVQQGVARVLGIPQEKVTVVQTVTGGGFGGKEEVPTQIAAFAALLAWHAKRPVKLVLTRSEDSQLTSKRHPMKMRYKAGVSNAGKLMSMEIEILADGGAYSSLSPVVLFRSTVHAGGPYEIPHARIDTYGLYTNHPPAGAFRGFGQPQVAFACESVMDELAYGIDMDPIEFRLGNLLRLHSTTLTGQTLTESVGLEETLLRARELSRWDEVYRPRETARAFSVQDIVTSPQTSKRKGIGVATIHYGVSLGAKGKHLDRSAALLRIAGDGMITVEIGGTEMGQGAFTVIAQIAADGLGVPLSWITLKPVSTANLPDCGPTVASRTTVFSGNAVLKAATALKRTLLEFTAKMYHLPVDELDIIGGIVRRKSTGGTGAGNLAIRLQEIITECHRNRIELTAEGQFHSPDTSFADEDGQGDAYITYSYTTHIAEVEVDVVTGRVDIVQFTAVQDVGKALNPGGVEGQMEGGILQGIGYALYEDFQIGNGAILTDTFSTYIVPTSLDIPERIELDVVEAPYPEGPFGAKGVGEPALIPAPAAVANAVSHALGIRIERLPMGPERILSAIYHREQ